MAVALAIIMAVTSGLGSFANLGRGWLLVVFVASAGLDSTSVGGGRGYGSVIVVVAFVARRVVGGEGDGRKESEAGSKLDHLEKTVFSL